jgi:hypothetical protein
MKYEKALQKLKEMQPKLEKYPELRKTTPRGQPIERRTFKTLNSKVKPSNWNS